MLQKTCESSKNFMMAVKALIKPMDYHKEPEKYFS